ncbi:MAG TPA: endonuclease III [Gemmatimonadales bacterium]|nr:endonuclease III [Gemmatimonadales bacterium]
MLNEKGHDLKKFAKNSAEQRGSGKRKRSANHRSVRRSARPPVRPSALLETLKELYPDAKCALHHRNAYELLCATILSAQCTDARVNLVTPELFSRYPSPFELANADPAELEEIIRSTGFFRNKTRSLIGMAQAIVERHGGEVPRTMEELRRLPGVGRKTANVVLGNAFATNEGVTVDTHVSRLSGLLGLSREREPEKIEQELMRLFPRESWGLLSHLLIFHGRQVCIARRPRCGSCVLAKICPSANLISSS